MIANLAAVLLNYNDGERVLACAKTLLTYDVFKYIVIVDNKSTKPNQIEILSSLKDTHIVLLQSEENKGYAAGNNIGLRYLEDKGIDVVHTLNADMEISKKAILDCYNFLLNHKEIAACEIPMKEKNGKVGLNYYDIPSFKTSMINWVSTFTHKCLCRVNYEGYFTCGYVRESAAFYNYKYFKQIGFYDEDFFLYEEGPASSNLFRKLGYKEAIVEDGEYCIHHHIGHLMNRRLFKIFKQSRSHYLRKYCGCNGFQVFLVNLIFLNVFPPQLRKKKKD